MNPKLVVITGASSGIGRATALRFAAEGWVVVAMARTSSALLTLQQEAQQAARGKVVVCAVDAADGAAVAAAAAGVIAEHGVPDVVVNSAGLGQWKYLEDTSSAELAQMMGAPFFAAAHVTGAFLSRMIQRKSGRILHVGSPASLQPWPGSTAYASSRWALRGLHEALRMDLSGTGVSSHHMLFGEVSSSYFTNNPASREHIPRVASIIPIMTPEECADVLWAAGSSSSRPSAQVFRPWLLGVFFWAHALFPAIFRALVVRTGRRR